MTVVNEPEFPCAPRGQDHQAARPNRLALRVDRAVEHAVGDDAVADRPGTEGRVTRP